MSLISLFSLKIIATLNMDKKMIQLKPNQIENEITALYQGLGENDTTVKFFYEKEKGGQVYVVNLPLDDTLVERCIALKQHVDYKISHKYKITPV